MIFKAVFFFSPNCFETSHLYTTDGISDQCGISNWPALVQFLYSTIFYTLSVLYNVFSSSSLTFYKENKLSLSAHILTSQTIYWNCYFMLIQNLDVKYMIWYDKLPVSILMFNFGSLVLSFTCLSKLTRDCQYWYRSLKILTFFRQTYFYWLLMLSFYHWKFLLTEQKSLSNNCQFRFVKRKNFIICRRMSSS